MKKFYAMLISPGQDYWVNGRTFYRDKEQEVSEVLYEYLKPSILFQVRFEEVGDVNTPEATVEAPVEDSEESEKVVKKPTKRTRKTTPKKEGE